MQVLKGAREDSSSVKIISRAASKSAAREMVAEAKKAREEADAREAEARKW